MGKRLVDAGPAPAAAAEKRKSFWTGFTGLTGQERTAEALCFWLCSCPVNPVNPVKEQLHLPLAPTQTGIALERPHRGLRSSHSSGASSSPPRPSARP